MESAAQDQWEIGALVTVSWLRKAYSLHVSGRAEDALSTKSCLSRRNLVGRRLTTSVSSGGNGWLGANLSHIATGEWICLVAAPAELRQLLAGPHQIPRASRLFTSSSCAAALSTLMVQYDATLNEPCVSSSACRVDHQRAVHQLSIGRPRPCSALRARTSWLPRGRSRAAERDVRPAGILDQLGHPARRRRGRRRGRDARRLPPGEPGPRRRVASECNVRDLGVRHRADHVSSRRPSSRPRSRS